MLHAIYFKKHINGEWHLLYNNRYVQTESFRFEKHVKNRPSFLPAVEGDAVAVVAAFVLNWVSPFSVHFRPLGSTIIKTLTKWLLT